LKDHLLEVKKAVKIKSPVGLPSDEMDAIVSL